MMRLGGKVHCTKISTEFEFGGHSLLGAHPSPQKCGIGLRRCENQRRLSIVCYKIGCSVITDVAAFQRSEAQPDGYRRMSVLRES